MEDLAVDDLAKQEELAKKTSSSHLLALDVEETAKAAQPQEAQMAQPQPTQSEGTQAAQPVQGAQSAQTPSEEPTAQPAAQTTQKAQEAPAGEEPKDDLVKTPKEAQVASEAYKLSSLSTALEEEGKESKDFTRMDDHELGKEGLSWLKHVGINYGLPILKHVGSAIMFTAVQLVKFLFTSLGDIKNYISRRFDSYEDLQHEIAVLHNSVDDVKKDTAEGNFTDQKVIDSLKIEKSVDLKANMTSFSKFMTEVMTTMVTSSLEDFNQTANYVEQDLGSLNAKPSNILKLKELGSIVKPGTIEGYTDIPENTHSLISTDVLPGDIRLLLVVPKVGIDDEEAYVKAYQSSYSALVADASSYKHVTNISYLSKNELKAHLNELNKFMLACIKHKLLFEQLMSSKMKLRFSFKAYLNQIFNASKKLDVKTSMIELIYVKTIFAEKVYIKASMDMHDYAVRVLKANIKFAQSNIKHLQ